MNRSNQIFFFLLILAKLTCAQDTIKVSLDFEEQQLPFGFTSYRPVALPEVALALSGGGSRGLAQIGVLRAFEEADIPVNIIVGTSMGSIVGGLYAAGYTTSELDSVARYTNWDDLLSPDRETNRRELFIDQKITEDKAIFALRLKGLTPILPTSINSGQRLSTYLNLLSLQAPIHIDTSFDQFRIKFRAVCTDLVTGNSVVLDRGSLSHALRASSSVSFFLTPVKMDSLILVDGGLVANIPVEVARYTGGDLIVAVNTTSSLHSADELAFPWIVADQIVSIPMKLLNEQQLDMADFVLSPSLDQSSTDFTNVESLIQAGYENAKKITDSVKLKIDSLFYAGLETDTFYINNVLPPDGQEIGRYLIEIYSRMDSVSNYQIMYDLKELSRIYNYNEISANIIRGGNGSVIEFVAKEAPVVRDVIVNQLELINDDLLQPIIESLEGLPYSGELTYKAVMEILRFYRKNGYSLADLRSHSFDPASGILHLQIDEGKINKVIIEGNDVTSSTVIEREFTVQKGDYFRYNEVEQGLVNLRSTNLFDDIVLTVHNNDGNNVIRLRVLERISSLIRFGFRIDNENRLQLSADLRDENLFGSGTEMGLLLFGGTRNRAYLLEHKSNRVLNTYFTYNISAYYKFDDVTQYISDPLTEQDRFSRSSAGEYRQIYYGASLSLGTQVRRFGNLIFKGKYQYDEIKNKTGSPVSPYKIKIVTLQISTTIDTQDKYPFPSKGVYFFAAYETAQQLLGGDIGFTNIGFEYRNYIPLDRSNVISPRIQMGFGDKTLPLSEQYSIGGQNSFFGMREDEFRGRQIFLSSLEYRYFLPFGLFFDTYVKLRYDLGSAWDLQERIRFRDLKHGIGVTLSFDTPIGPAEFSGGRSFYFVNNQPQNPVRWSDWQFYFSIGYYY